jgi:protein SCO1/2
MRLPHWFHLTALFVPVMLAGCGGGPSSTPGDGGYDVRAKVVAITPDKPAVTLDHEAIPGLMKAMEMEFRVADPKLLAGLKAGDKVRGRLKKTDSGLLITSLEKSE